MRSLLFFVTTASCLLLVGCGCTDVDVVARASTAANEKNAHAMERALTAAHLVVVPWTPLSGSAKPDTPPPFDGVIVSPVRMGDETTLALVHPASDDPELWARGDDGRLHRVDVVHDVTSSRDFEQCGCVWGGGGGAPPPPPPSWMIAVKSADEVGAPVTLHVPFESVTAHGSKHGSTDCPPPP